MASRGTSLPAELSTFAGRTISARWAFAALRDILAPPAVTTVLSPGDNPPVATTMNHLSTRAMAFASDSAQPCQVLPLTLRVAVPAAAAGATPMWVRDGLEPRAVPVADGAGVLTDEWSTCSSTGRIALVHGGRGGDGALFGVTATLTPAPAFPSAVLPGAATAKARLTLSLARRLRLVKGKLQFKVDVARAGKLTVRVDTKPRVRRVVLLKRGKQTVRISIPKKAKLARRGNRVSLSFTDPLAAKPVTASAKVVLSRVSSSRQRNR